VDCRVEKYKLETGSQQIQAIVRTGLPADQAMVLVGDSVWLVKIGEKGFDKLRQHKIYEGAAHKSGALSFSLHEEGKLLATIHSKAIKLWSLPDAKLLRELQPHKDQDIYDVCISHSKEWVASVGEDKQCVISEIKDGSTIKALSLPKKSGEKSVFKFVKFGAEDVFVYTAQVYRVGNGRMMNGKEGVLVKGAQVTKWKASDWTEVKTLHASSEPVSCFAISKNGKILGVGTAEGSIRLIMVDKMQTAVSVDQRHGVPITGMCFLPPYDEDSKPAVVSVSLDQQASILPIQSKPVGYEVLFFLLLVFWMLWYFFVMR